VGSVLATVWLPVEGALPAVYRIKKLNKWLRSKGLYRYWEKKDTFIY
jgi:hypothetical protein